MSISRPIQSNPGNGTGTYTPNTGATSATLVGMPMDAQSTGGSSNLEVYDEGVLLTPAASLFNFTGAAVTATNIGTAVTVNIPGFTTQDEGVLLSNAVTTLNFVGAGVVASGAGAITTVTVPVGAAGVVLDNSASPTYPTAPQTDGIWYGTGTKANTATATNVNIGNSAISSGSASTACGSSSQATGIQSTAYGNLAIASFNNATAIGALTTASAAFATALGKNVTASSTFATSLGGSSQATATNATAVGAGAAATAATTVALGSNATADTASGVAIGYLASTNAIANSIVFNATGAPLNVIDTAHAFVLGINSTGVNPGSLGVQVNGATFQLPLYSSLFASTATAAATTTLTVASARTQRFSGATTQTCKLPVVTTLANGFEFVVLNDSTGAVTVQSSGANTITTLAAAVGAVNRGGWGRFICVDTTGGTGVASWSYLAGSTAL